MRSSDALGPDRTALITGASRGIGSVIARRIAAEGNHIVLTGRSVTDLQAVASELSAGDAGVTVLPMDLTAPGAPQALVDAVEHQRGGIDLLVNNAGGDPLREFHSMTIEQNLQILQLNLVAPVALTRAAM